jgi:signal transduction histidine kinase
VSRKRRTRWRQSLYARSALFIALGTGAILGAVATLSSLVVDRSVDRLLEERSDLARTTAALLEQQVRAELARLPPGDPEEVATLGRAFARRLLTTLIPTRRGGHIDLALVDSTGAFLAATDQEEILHHGDHAGALSRALRERREVRGHCHSCHVRPGGGAPARTTDIMAFAPLATLALGVVVHQPEAEALEPAISLGGHLLVFGAGFAALFVLFAGLSVYSVVKPITRLTRAVRSLEQGVPLDLHPLGNDEVGELGRAVARWHGRMEESQSQIEQHRVQEQVLERVLEAQEDERRRVARELHDTVSQELAALRLEIERLTRHADSPALAAELERLEERARHMLETLRVILLDLRLSELEHMGFLPAAKAHLERVQREHGLHCVLYVEGDEIELGYEVAVTLFRILQESLQNVLQHAQAEHVIVTLSFRPGEVELGVEDDGCGLDVAAWRARRSSPEVARLGLRGMEERCRLLGGRMELASSAGEGTTLRVTAPCTRAPQAGRRPLES